MTSSIFKKQKANKLSMQTFDNRAGSKNEHESPLNIHEIGINMGDMVQQQEFTPKTQQTNLKQ